MADYRQAANSIARAENIPPWLFRRLIGAESSWNPGAVSGAGAIGLGQLMPDTARGLGVNPRDPIDNLRGSARYLRQQFERFGNWRSALAAYNAGPGAVEKAGGVPAFSETRAYVQKILGNRNPGGGGGSRSGGGDAGALLGSLSAQEAPGARSLPQGSAGLLPLLQALSAQQGPSQAPSSGVAAPAFSAGPVLPAGMRVPVSSGGPARRPDVGALLAAIAGQQGAGVEHASIPGVQGLVRGGPSSAGGPRVQGRSPTGGRGKLIGTPYAGTHNLGNWQSDNAVDIRLPVGSPIYSTGTGRVVKVRGSYQGGGDRFDGVQVTIQTPAGQRFYTHLKSANVRPGQRIKRGQQIGLSGAANGVPHLHFAAQERDPRSFVR